MSPPSLEERVERLERVVEAMRGSPVREPGRDDWRATVGAFADDPIAKEIIDEALRCARRSGSNRPHDRPRHGPYLAVAAPRQPGRASHRSAPRRLGRSRYCDYCRHRGRADAWLAARHRAVSRPEATGHLLRQIDRIRSFLQQLEDTPVPGICRAVIPRYSAGARQGCDDGPQDRCNRPGKRRNTPLSKLARLSSRAGTPCRRLDEPVAARNFGRRQRNLSHETKSREREYTRGAWGMISRSRCPHFSSLSSASSIEDSTGTSKTIWVLPSASPGSWRAVREKSPRAP